MGLLLTAKPAPPTSSDPPLLHRLFRRVRVDPRIAWRVQYNIPANDPRALSLTQHEAMMDLAEIRYFEAAQRVASDPSAVAEAAERSAEVREALRDGIDEVRDMGLGDMVRRSQERREESLTPRSVTITKIRG